MLGFRVDAQLLAHISQDLQNGPGRILIRETNQAGKTYLPSVSVGGCLLQSQDTNVEMRDGPERTFPS